jgi:DNA mismatch repair protein MutS
MDQLSFLNDAGGAASPIRRQYLDTKRRYPDAILLFRLGDFYETFDDDARILSSELEIALTGREMGRGERVPLAGIPYHAAEGYIARLIAKGYKVAICEQLGTTPVRGLVPREVVRVITPGTLVEDTLLPSRANNYLASVVASFGGAAIALADISTGEFLATEIHQEQWEGLLTSELERVSPAECIVARVQTEYEALVGLLPRGCFVTQRDIPTSQAVSERLLKDHFAVATLDGLGLTSAPLAARAAAALLSYLRETRPTAIDQMQSIHLYSLDRFMKLDASARRNLELLANATTGAVEGSLLSVLDLTRTAMGGRLLRRWIGQPLLDRAAIDKRLDAVQEMVKTSLGRSEAIGILGTVGDLERLASRASQQSLTPRDCQAISRSLKTVPSLLRILERWMPQTLAAQTTPLDPCPDVVKAIDATIAEEPAVSVGDGVIRSGRSTELDELRTMTGDTRQWIASLERQERERTGVRSLKVGFNKVFGYYIEVTRPNLDAPTDEWARLKTGATRVSELLDALGYQRKQTIANAERFVTAELKEQELRLQNAQAEIEALEKQIYAELLAELVEAAPSIKETAQSLANLDALLSLAETAAAGRYVRPLVDDSADIDIQAGRHPVVERLLPAGDYVPNGCELSGNAHQIAVITGPNMAGKSTYVLGVALIALMAQIGSFVPAAEARIGIVDRIFTRVGAQHDISGGKSTFLVEMSETANILHNATPRSLVLLDEVGRGTSTYDGMAIARAVIEQLHNASTLRCRTLFATHYHELTELEGLLPRVFNLRMEVLEEGNRVVFLHRVVPGGADRSYGIHVAQLAGVPAPVIRRARQILELLENPRDGTSPPARDTDERRDTRYDRLAEDIRSLDITCLTPLQALTKLNELQKLLAEDEC